MKKLIVFLCLIPVCCFAALNDEEKSKVSDVNGEVTKIIRAQAGSKSALTNNFIHPLNSSDKLRTFDGKKEFDFQLAGCEASKSFLEMNTQPQPNGKIRILTIKQDSTMDGNFDYLVQPNLDVDLVCANGFSTCSNIDDFSTCESFTWEANEKKVSISRTGMGSLGGCYCISGRCGQNLAWRNLKTVIKDLSSGAARSLTSENPFFTVGAVEINGTLGIVRGGTGACSASDVTDLTDAPSKDELLSYSKNPNNLKSDGKGKMDTSTLFGLINNGSLNANETAEYRTCTITRTPQLEAESISDIIVLDGGEGGVRTCGEECIEIVLGKQGDNYWAGNGKDYYFHTGFYLKKPERVKSAHLSYAAFDDWIQVAINAQYFWSGPYNNWNYSTPEGVVPGKHELSTSWKYSPNVSFMDYIPDKPGHIRFDARVNVTGNGEGYLYGRMDVDLDCKDKNDDVIADGCTAYREDEDCVVDGEEVDGVMTVANGVITGLSPITQSRTYTSESCNTKLHRPWFKKKRTYRCKSKNDFDLTYMRERSKHIKDSTTNTDYQDVTFNSDGTKNYGSGTLNFDGLPTTNACTSVCKVRKEVAVPTTLQGTKDQNKVNRVDQYEVSYKECYIPVGESENKCDLGDGEALVTPCQCQNAFAEATGMMQVMRLAGQDMICSSGEFKMPDGTEKPPEGIPVP